MNLVENDEEVEPICLINQSSGSISDDMNMSLQIYRMIWTLNWRSWTQSLILFLHLVSVYLCYRMENRGIKKVTQMIYKK